jgi:hypothetical protein
MSGLTVSTLALTRNDYQSLRWPSLCRSGHCRATLRTTVDKCLLTWLEDHKEDDTLGDHEKANVSDALVQVHLSSKHVG